MWPKKAHGCTDVSGMSVSEKANKVNGSKVSGRVSERVVVTTIIVIFVVLYAASGVIVFAKLIIGG